MRLHIDVNQFQKALREYEKETGKDGAEVLNRAGRNVAYRSAQNTPAATAARIRTGMFKDPHLRYALTAIALKKRGIGILETPEFAKEVERFVSRRASSARYLRAAWAKAVEAMGGTFRGSKFKGAGGSGRKASIRRLIAELVAITSQPDDRHARSAENVGIKALQKAIDFVAADMLAHAERKMAQRAREHSAK